MNAPWNNEDLRRAFDADFDALVAFASRSKARVGFAFLRADGQVDLGRPLDARISARMTHVFALAQMRGIEGGLAPGQPRPRRPYRTPARSEWLLVRRGRSHVREQRHPRSSSDLLSARPVGDDRRCGRRRDGRAR